MRNNQMMAGTWIIAIFWLYQQLMRVSEFDRHRRYIAFLGTKGFQNAYTQIPTEPKSLISTKITWAIPYFVGYRSVRFRCYLAKP